MSMIRRKLTVKKVTHKKTNRIYNRKLNHTTKRIKLIKGGVKHMETIQENLMRATVVEGQYAEEIRQALLRPPSPTALARNKKAQALLRKLRR